MSEVSSFTDIYDQYRFDWIEVHVVATNQLPLAPVGGTPTVTPKLLMAIDYDDILTPTSTNQLLAYENVQIISCGESRTFRFKPHSASYVWDGTTSVVGGNDTGKWLDAAQTGVLHLGLKYAVYTNNCFATWNVFFRYTYSCKNIR